MKSLPCFLLLLIGIFFNINVSAQPELDTSFAGSGKLVIQFGSTGTTQDLLIQPDDKIVLVGGCFSINFGSFPFCLLRLNPNGSFDTTLNNGGTPAGGGYVYTPVPGASGGPGAKGIALQSDGKIVAVGSGNFSNQRRMILIRYNANGTLDQTFGTGGIVTTAYGGDTQGAKVVVQPDGRIVVVGYTGNDSSSTVRRQFVARFTASGAPDASFGSGGSVSVGTEANSTNGLSIALQPDGKILTGGLMMVDSSAAYLLARLNADGSPDTTFDADGLNSVASGTIFSESYGFRSLAVQSNGRILALGHGNALFRFEKNGALDASFGSNGRRQALGDASDAYAVTVTPSGKITAVGYPAIPTFSPIAYRTARYLPNGAPDPNYSDDGYLDIDVEPSLADGATAAAFDSQGRLVIAGMSGSGPRLAPFGTPQFSVARLLATPSRIVSFTGRIAYANGKPVSGATLALKRGTETIAVGRSNPFGYYRFRDVPSGQTYDLSARAKNTTFAARTVLVDDEINEFLIVGEKSTQQ